MNNMEKGLVPTSPQIMKTSKSGHDLLVDIPPLKRQTETFMIKPKNEPRALGLSPQMGSITRLTGLRPDASPPVSQRRIHSSLENSMNEVTMHELLLKKNLSEEDLEWDGLQEHVTNNHIQSSLFTSNDQIKLNQLDDISKALFNALGKLHERNLDGIDVLHDTLTKELSLIKTEVHEMKLANFENNRKSTLRQILVSVIMAVMGLIYALLNIFIIRCKK